MLDLLFKTADRRTFRASLPADYTMEDLAAFVALRFRGLRVIKIIVLASGHEISMVH